jgi:hypothetical protein
MSIVAAESKPVDIASMKNTFQRRLAPHRDRIQMTHTWLFVISISAEVVLFFSPPLTPARIVILRLQDILLVRCTSYKFVADNGIRGAF